MTKGYIHVYTGDGKGKTTAAVGLAIRAVGAGKKVCILQFMKSFAYSEQKIKELGFDIAVKFVKGKTQRVIVKKDAGES